MSKSTFFCLFIYLSACGGCFYALHGEIPIMVFETKFQCEMELANNANTYCDGNKMFIGSK